jgi:hypothetical protein
VVFGGICTVGSCGKGLRASAGCGDVVNPMCLVPFRGEVFGGGIVWRSGQQGIGMRVLRLNWRFGDRGRRLDMLVAFLWCLSAWNWGPVNGGMRWLFSVS